MEKDVVIDHVKGCTYNEEGQKGHLRSINGSKAIRKQMDQQSLSRITSPDCPS